MRTVTSLRRFAAASFLFLTTWATVHAAAIPATIDTDEHLATPVPHRYVHGVIPDDAKFQLALPDNWNGKLASPLNLPRSQIPSLYARDGSENYGPHPDRA
jgi:hypothetical protein